MKRKKPLRLLKELIRSFYTAYEKQPANLAFATVCGFYISYTVEIYEVLPLQFSAIQKIPQSS